MLVAGVREDTMSLLQTIRRLLASLCLLAIVGVTLSTAASAQSSDQTGRRVTDFSDVLSVSQFDPSQGELVQANFTISGSFDSRVLQITNKSNETADFNVSTFVGLCADRLSVLGSISYPSCTATSTTTGLNLTTSVLQEQFAGLTPGSSASSAAPLQASDAASISVTDPATLSAFTGTGVVDFGVVTLAGFEASGAGGNSLVEVETFADVAISVDYLCASVSIVTTTNGDDGISVNVGSGITWQYTVTNTCTADLANLEVTDSLGGKVCVISFLAAGASQTCTTNGVAGDSAYNNVGSVTGTPAINPAVTVTADDPTSYVGARPVANLTPATPVSNPSGSTNATTPSTDPGDEVFGGLENPAIDIEIATNGIQADIAPGPAVNPGSIVELSYQVTNTGTVDLSNVVVVDDNGNEVCRQASLAIANGFSCSVTVVATCGQQAHSADVRGRSSAGVTVRDVDPTHHMVGCQPATNNGTPPQAIAAEPPAPAPAAVPATDTEKALAFTGIDDAPTELAVSLLGLGFAAVFAAEGFRRRQARRD